MDDAELIARTVYAEGYAWGDEVMLAIAHVIINNGNNTKETCDKLPCWWPNDPNIDFWNSVTIANDFYKKAIAIVNDVMDGSMSDPTNGATFYYQIGDVPPERTKGKTPSLDLLSHKFYNDVPL